MFEVVLIFVREDSAFEFTCTPMPMKSVQIVAQSIFCLDNKLKISEICLDLLGDILEWYSV